MTAPQDPLALATQGIDIESAESLKAAFIAFFDQVTRWEVQAKAIKVTDVDQRREMKLARESRLALRDIRLQVEAARKRLKEDSLRKGRAVDGIANVLKGLIEPIEAHLLEQETFAARVEAERKRAEEARVAELLRQAEEAERAEARERERLERARIENERAAREEAQRQENERLRRDLAERDAAARAEREKREALERELRAAAAPAPAADPIVVPIAIAPDEAPIPVVERASDVPAVAPRSPVPTPAAPPQATAPMQAIAPVAAAMLPGVATGFRVDISVDVRDLPNGSASAAERTIACPASLALPRVNRSSKYSTRGHGIHGYIRAVLAGVGQAQALAAVDEEHRTTCRLVDWRKLCGGLTSLRVEVAYAIDVRARTARYLGENIGRGYAAAAIAQGRPLGEWEVPGSLDIEGEAGRPVIIDVKSGFRDVTPAEENGQGLFFGSVKHLLEGADEVEFRIAKLKPDGDVWLDVARYTAWQLDAYLDDYEAALERSKRDRRVYLAGGTPDVNEGMTWCGYCPAANACPAKTAMARAMLAELGKVDAALEHMSPEQLGRAYEIAHDRAKPIIDRVLGVAKERALAGAPVPLSGGLELREVAYPKKTLDGDSVLSLAQELGATDAQIKGCYRETTVRQARACKAPHAQRKAG